MYLLQCLSYLIHDDIEPQLLLATNITSATTATSATDTAGEFPLSDTGECRKVGSARLSARFVSVPVHPAAQVERHGRPDGLQVQFGYPDVACLAEPEGAYRLRDRALNARTPLVFVPECLRLLIEPRLL